MRQRVGHDHRDVAGDRWKTIDLLEARRTFGGTQERLDLKFGDDDRADRAEACRFGGGKLADEPEHFIADEDLSGESEIITVRAAEGDLRGAECFERALAIEKIEPAR